MTQEARWPKASTNQLIEAVDDAMELAKFVDFDLISQRINRSPRSCKQKAYGLGLIFTMKRQPRVVSDNPKEEPKHNIKYDMVTLPYHANGRRVNYA